MRAWSCRHRRGRADIDRARGDENGGKEIERLLARKYLKEDDGEQDENKCSGDAGVTGH